MDKRKGQAGEEKEVGGKELRLVKETPTVN